MDQFSGSRSRGMDTSGFAFQRMVSQIVRPQVARVAVQPPIPETIPPDRVSTLQFSVANTGPSAVFDITGREHVQAVRPPELSLGSNATGIVDVDVLPVSTPTDTAIRVTVDATVRGQPDLSNSSTVELPEPGGVFSFAFGSVSLAALRRLYRRAL